MADERIEIEITLDDGTIKRGLARVERNAKTSSNKIGKSLDRNISQRLTKSFSLLNSQILLVGTSLLAALGSRRIIQAANMQEDAITALNQSLKSAGTFSREASRSIQEFAASMQASTRFGDEVILQQTALARNFARTNEEAVKLVRAAVELSEATGISLDSSVKNLGKTFAGLTGELGESLPIIRTLTAEQLKAGGALDLVLQRFSGTAAAQVRTFSGATEQAANAFGDLLEELGFIVTRSPAAVSLINTLGKAFSSAARSISAFREGGDVFQSLIIQLAEFGRALSFFVIAPLEITFNVISSAFDGLRTVIQTFVVGAAGIFANFVNSIGLQNTKLGESVNNFAMSATSTLEGFAEKQRENFGKIFDVDLAQRSDIFLQQVQDTVNRTNAVTSQTKPISVVPTAEETGITFEQFQASFNDSANKIKLTAKDLAKTVRNSIGPAFSSAFSAVGAALATGGNAFEGFGKSVLRSIGALAIQLGQFFILVGLGMTATGPLLKLSGGQAVAAGIALTIFGGALQAIGGGGAGTQAGGVAGAGGTVGAPDQGEQLAAVPTEDLEPRTGVTVNIEGNVLDRQETGLAIAEILREQFDSEAVTVTG